MLEPKKNKIQALFALNSPWIAAGGSKTGRNKPGNVKEVGKTDAAQDNFQFLLQNGAAGPAQLLHQDVPKARRNNPVPKRPHDVLEPGETNYINTRTTRCYDAPGQEGRKRSDALQKQATGSTPYQRLEISVWLGS